MKVLVIGSGGREHALAWKLAQSARVDRVYVAPGNGGTAHEHKCENVGIKATDIPALIEFAQREAVAVTVVGPEQPLVAGVVDAAVVVVVDGGESSAESESPHAVSASASAAISRTAVDLRPH